MLTLQLLRVRTKNGAIFPLFCNTNEELELARRIIEEFKYAWKSKERKVVLEDRIAAIEESGNNNNSDYKLVRGFYYLLERRCSFKSKNIATENGNINKGNDVSPFQIRKALFEESSKRGLALSDIERREIADSVASKLHLSSADYILKVMRNDLDDNLILDQFHVIDAEALVGWYNLSLMQTLLFNCTKLDFYISGGSNWKRVLRNVKRLGLMYQLEQRRQEQQQIICSLEGPLSLFKLTDRYGTSLAKLLPSIILPSYSNHAEKDEWYIDAWIMRKTIEGRKMYEFKISRDEMPSLLTDHPYLITNNSKKSSLNRQYIFDSTVEERFANRFEQAETGWKLIREPDPLVLSNGGAFIPDFMFEKYGKKVYLEIVGFWTKEYIERKLKKLTDIISKNRNNDNNADLLTVINEDLVCSKSAFSSLIPKERLIFYRNGIVPIKPVLDYLNSIDREIIEKKVNDPDLKLELNDNDIISINEIAQQRNIPIEVARRISLRDNEGRYIDAGMYLIPKSKAQKLKSLLAETSKFTDACSLLSKEAIPESCQAELVNKLGYDVLWQSIDTSTAFIIKKGKED